jgi:hypothetical protein
MSRGSGPTTSTPGSVMISLMKVRPMSHLAFGEQLHRASAALGELDLRFHRVSDARSSSFSSDRTLGSFD